VDSVDVVASIIFKTHASLRSIRKGPRRVTTYAYELPHTETKHMQIRIFIK